MFYQIVNRMNYRKEMLGISHARIAELSGVSLSTVQRAMSDEGNSTTIENLEKIAMTIGLAIKADKTINSDKMIESRAREKAHEMAMRVQATSAMEAQGVSEEAFTAIENEIFYDLMVGSRRKLWND